MKNFMQKILLVLIAGLCFATAFVGSAAPARADHWTRSGGYDYYVRGSTYFWTDPYGQWFYWNGYAWVPGASPFGYVRPFYQPYYRPYGPLYRPYYFDRFGRRHFRDTDRDGIPNRRDRDIDGDGIPNRRDRDRDGDGVPNRQDRRD